MQDRPRHMRLRRAGFARSPLGPALVVAAVAVGLLVFLGPWAEPPGGAAGVAGPRPAVPEERDVEGSRAAPAGVAPEAAEGRRVAVGLQVATWGPAPPWPGARARILGRVVDEQGRVVKGARVRFVPDRLTADQARGWFAAGWPEVLSAVDGSFELNGPWVPPVLRAASQSHWTLRDRACGVRVEADGFALTTAEVKLDSERSADAGELVLLREAEVRGRVVDASGVPRAGLRVELAEQGEKRALHWLLSSDDGCFRIEAARGEGFELRVRDAHGWRAHRKGLALGDEPLDLGDLVLSEGRSIAGRVVDGADAPVAGARVVAFDCPPTFDGIFRGGAWDERPDMRVLFELKRGGQPTSTDAEGRFLLTQLSGSAWGVMVDHPGYEPRMIPQVPVGSTDCLLELEPEGRIELRVTDAATGLAVPGLQVRATRDTGWTLGRMDSPVIELEVLAGPGASELAGLGTADPSLVIVRRAGSATQEIGAWAPGYAFQTLTVSDMAPGDHRAERIELERERVLRGRVVDGRGEGLPGVCLGVRVERPRNLAPPGAARAFSDEGGRFELATGVGSQAFHLVVQPPPGFAVPHPIHLSGDGTPSTPRGRVELSPEGELFVQLSPAAVLSGLASDEWGEPLAGQLVSVLPADAPEALAQRAQCDGQGQFCFEGLEPGSWTLVAADVAYAPVPESLASQSLFVHLDAGEREYVALGLGGDRAPFQVEGLVTHGGTELPLEGVLVRMKLHYQIRAGSTVFARSEATSQSNGFYSMRPSRHARLGEPDGATVEVELPGGGLWVQPFEHELEGHVQLDLVLPHRPLAGRVVESGSGLPIAGAAVGLDEPDGAFTTDTYGRFELPHALAVARLPGVVARREGYLDAEVRPTAEQRRGETELVIELVRPAQVFGTVSGGGERGPWAGLQVVLTKLGSSPRTYSSGSLQEGAFRIGRLRPGRYRVSLAGVGDQRVAMPCRLLGRDSNEIELGSGEELELALELL